MAEKGLAFLLRAADAGTTVTFDDVNEEVDWSSHGLSDGDPITFTTTGTLPTFSSGTFSPAKVYYANVVLAGTITLHPTKTDGVAGTNGIALTSTGSGTHTAYKMPVIAGLRSNSFTINGGSVDVTTKDSAGQWRELKPGAGVVSMSLSGTGMFQDNSNVIEMRARTITRARDPYSVVFQSGDEYSGFFQIASVENAGDHDDGVTYSLSLENAGEIFFVANT